MHGRSVAVDLHGPGRGAHHAHHVHAAPHTRGQGRVLHRPHAPVRPERAGAPLSLPASGRLSGPDSIWTSSYGVFLEAAVEAAEAAAEA